MCHQNQHGDCFQLFQVCVSGLHCIHKPMYHKILCFSTILGFLDSIKEKYIEKNVIHLILDQASYNKAFEVREYAYKLGIHLHYLPPYSPNLNSIERLWKVMNEKARNNVFFETAKKFKMRIKQFFDDEVDQILPNLRSTINDKFHIKKTAN